MDNLIFRADENAKRADAYISKINESFSEGMQTLEDLTEFNVDDAKTYKGTINDIGGALSKIYMNSQNTTNGQRYLE